MGPCLSSLTLKPCHKQQTALAPCPSPTWVKPGKLIPDRPALLIALPQPLPPGCAHPCPAGALPAWLNTCRVKQ